MHAYIQVTPELLQRYTIWYPKLQRRHVATVFYAGTSMSTPQKWLGQRHTWTRATKGLGNSVPRAMCMLWAWSSCTWSPAMQTHGPSMDCVIMVWMTSAQAWIQQLDSGRMRLVAPTLQSVNYSPQCIHIFVFSAELERMDKCNKCTLNTTFVTHTAHVCSVRNQPLQL